MRERRGLVAKQVKQLPYSPLLYQYLKKYQQDPTSRVFAPLAEAYRKTGLIDEAIEIAREGLLVHPQFVGGRVALSRALFDKKLYAEVIQELSSIIRDVPDNIVAQKLLAESFLILGRLAESLGAYKALLFFNPNDPEISKIVKELETQAYENGTLVLQSASEDEWVDQFELQSTKKALNGAPLEKRGQRIRQIELLQNLLQNVERYRQKVSSLA